MDAGRPGQGPSLSTDGPLRPAVVAPRTPLVLLVLVVLASAAVAQLPAPPSAAPSVSVSASPMEVSVSVEQPTVVTVSVENTSPATGSPLDQPRGVIVEATGAPEGWTVSVEPATFQLAPGENGTAELRIAVSTEASAKSATVTVTAKIFPLGVNVIPGVGPAADPEATDSVEVAAQREDPLTRDILENVGPWIYVLFLALLAAVLVTVRLVLVNRRVAVALRSEGSQVSVPRGGRASVAIHVENLTKQEDTVVFQVSTVGTGWAAFLPVPELQLPAEADEEVLLTVIASKELSAGTTQSILVSATSAQAPRRPATLAFDAVVEGAAGKRPK